MCLIFCLNLNTINMHNICSPAVLLSLFLPKEGERAILPSFVPLSFAKKIKIKNLSVVIVIYWILRNIPTFKNCPPIFVAIS